MRAGAELGTRREDGEQKARKETKRKPVRWVSGARRTRGAVGGASRRTLRDSAGGLLVEDLLEADEDSADFFGGAEVGDGVGDGVAVVEAENRGEFVIAF